MVVGWLLLSIGCGTPGQPLDEPSVVDLTAPWIGTSEVIQSHDKRWTVEALVQMGRVDEPLPAEPDGAWLQELRGQPGVQTIIRRTRRTETTYDFVTLSKGIADGRVLFRAETRGLGIQGATRRCEYEVETRVSFADEEVAGRLKPGLTYLDPNLGFADACVTVVRRDTDEVEAVSAPATTVVDHRLPLTVPGLPVSRSVVPTRSEWVHSKVPTVPDRYAFQDVNLDFTTCTWSVDGAASPMERYLCAAMALFATRPGERVTHNEIFAVTRDEGEKGLRVRTLHELLCKGLADPDQRIIAKDGAMGYRFDPTATR